MSDLLSPPKSRNARLRELIKTAPPVLAVGSHDALSARLVEQAGFDVVECREPTALGAASPSSIIFVASQSTRRRHESL